MTSAPEYISQRSVWWEGIQKSGGGDKENSTICKAPVKSPPNNNMSTFKLVAL